MTNRHADFATYLASLSAELTSQTDRIRMLIGDRHWLTDGHHKESLLASLIRRHVPSNMTVSRGFVVSPTDPSACSKEQDLLILDQDVEAPLFSNGDVVVTFPNAVLAAVSVKTTLRKRDVQEALAGLASLRKVLVATGCSDKVFCGGYFYVDGKPITNAPAKVYDYTLAALREPANLWTPKPLPQPPSMLRCGPDYLVSAQGLALSLTYSVNEDRTGVRIEAMGYDCGELATAFFVGQLLAHLAASRHGPPRQTGLQEVLSRIAFKQLKEAKRTVYVG